MEENKIFEAVNAETKKQEIPENLRPENIINKLGVQIDRESEASADVLDANRELLKDKKLKKPVSKVKRFVTVVAGIAAVIGVVLVGAHARNMYLDKSSVKGLYAEANKGFKVLASYNELTEYIEKQNKKADLDFSFSMGSTKGDINNAVPDMMPDEEVVYEEEAGDMTDGTGSTQDYSDTNVRTEGVFEADCVKTDGEYIYAINDAIENYSYFNGSRNISVMDVIKPDGEKTEYIAEYILDFDEYIDGDVKSYDFSDIILYTDKLIVLGHLNYSDNYNADTVIAVFDKTNVTEMELLDCFTVSGNYNQCRMRDGYLYVVSNERIDIEGVEPIVDGEEMKCEDIYICDVESYEEYLIVTSYDMRETPSKVDEMAVINDGYPELYASTENMYFLSSSYVDTMFSGTKQHLNILKFSYKDGNIEPVATTNIDGWLEDVFCVDEYDGNLRIVVTDDNSGKDINTLYVLDGNLEELGKIDDIAPGERIYSARFDGEIGYFVTFEQVDPLFSVDLSDPKNPKIIGELKIPGFSEYMYLWEENTMLGIGEEDGMIKLSMFDISDPYDVTEENKEILENAYYSTALYNHKAVLIDSEKNLIGFWLEGYNGDYGYKVDEAYGYFTGYCIYAYEDGEFVLKTEILLDSDYYTDVRGMYIGDYVYVVDLAGNVNVVSLDSYEVICTVEKSK